MMKRPSAKLGGVACLGKTVAMLPWKDSYGERTKASVMSSFYHYAQKEALRQGLSQAESKDHGQTAIANAKAMWAKNRLAECRKINK